MNDSLSDAEESFLGMIPEAGGSFTGVVSDVAEDIAQGLADKGLLQVGEREGFPHFTLTEAGKQRLN